MDDTSNQEQAIELLQQLGLKEYEAKAFVALARRQSGTAKDISETSEVPRTRVYDAVRVLESKGLVETQHSNPQVFRAVSIDEAINTLQTEYVERTEALRNALGGLQPVESGDSGKTIHEVWTLSGDRGITSRAQQLIAGAKDELIIVVGHESIFTEQLAEQLRTARNRGVTIIVGTADEELQAEVRDSVPEAEVFVSEIDWLSRSPLPDDQTEISRLLLADRNAILVSTFTESHNDERGDEHGVFGQGFDNGFVAIVRRLMATGLLQKDDPADTQV